MVQTGVAVAVVRVPTGPYAMRMVSASPTALLPVRARIVAMMGAAELVVPANRAISATMRACVRRLRHPAVIFLRKASVRGMWCFGAKMMRSNRSIAAPKTSSVATTRTKVIPVSKPALRFVTVRPVAMMGVAEVVARAARVKSARSACVGRMMSNHLWIRT